MNLWNILVAKLKKKKMHTEQKKIHNESELSTFAGTSYITKIL